MERDPEPSNRRPAHHRKGKSTGVGAGDIRPFFLLSFSLSFSLSFFLCGYPVFFLFSFPLSFFLSFFLS